MAREEVTVTRYPKLPFSALILAFVFASGCASCPTPLEVVATPAIFFSETLPSMIFAPDGLHSNTEESTDLEENEIGPVVAN